MIRPWLLPPGTAIPPLGAGDVPEVTAGTAREVASRLLLARPALLALKTDRILRAVEAAVEEWMDPACAARREAEAAFAAATGMPLATSPFAVPLEPCAHGAVREWVRAEVGSLDALDGFVPAAGGGSVRALGPALAVFILPGNVPGVWLPALIAALAGRTTCILKPASDDPLTPAAFAGTLIRHLPELAPALAVLPWRGGDEEVERAVLRDAEVLLWWGGAGVGGSLSRLVPPCCEVVAHGPALAAGAVAKESMTPGKLAAVAGGAARDTLLFDGRGCLSLSAIFLEQGGMYPPREAVGDFTKALASGSAALPPGRPTADAAALTQSWRARAKARAMAGKGTVLSVAGAGLDWTVIFDPEIPLPPVPLWRTLWLHPVARLDDIPAKAAVAGSGPVLHALAFAGPEQRGLELAGALAPGGLTRMCPFGRLQSPPLSWSGAGGISPFARLLRRVRMEK